MGIKHSSSILHACKMAGHSISITPVCTHPPRHSCIVFTQHPQSQFVVHAVIIAEQMVITVSENECIYQCDQTLNKMDTLYPWPQ